MKPSLLDVPHLTALAQIPKPIQRYKHCSRLLIPVAKTDSSMLVVNANCCVVAGLWLSLCENDWCLESASTDIGGKSAITGSGLPALVILWLEVCIALLHCLNREGSCWIWAWNTFFLNDVVMQFA